MPNIQMEITDSDHMVVRPIVFDVVSDIMSAIGMSQNTKILFPGSSDPEDLPVSTFDRQVNPVFGRELKVPLEVTERLVEDRSRVNVYDVNENNPIFLDPDTGVTVAPIYSHSEIEIGLTIRYPNRNAAEQQLADMKMAANRLRERLLHEINYSYLIPGPVLVILKEIWRCRETNLPYGQTFKEYLKEYISDQVTTKANVANLKQALAKNERQIRVQGFFDFDVIPEKAEQEDNKQYYTFKFVYTFRYDKVVGISMRYPHVVNNVHIGDAFYEHTQPYQLGLRLQIPARTTAYLDSFTSNNVVTGFKDGFPIPYHLDWTPKHKMNGMAGILRCMTLVNPADPRDLFSLSELGSVSLTDEMLAYMRDDYQNVGKLHESVVTITLYENERIRDTGRVILDADLNMRTDFDMDVRKRYNIWISVLASARYLKPAAIQRLANRGSFAIYILKAIDYTLEKRGLLPTLRANGTVDVKELMTALNSISNTRDPISGAPIWINYRVGNFVVESDRVGV